jgi:hypothetical protein
VQSGQLNNGSLAVTVIAIPQGSARNVAFGCDNGLQGKPPAELRVAIWQGVDWVVHQVIVDGGKGQTVVEFDAPASTSVVSVQRQDLGAVQVGYEVS